MIGSLTTLASQPPTLPGDDVRAQILRSPRGGGAYVPVLNLTVKALGLTGIIFQPEGRYAWSPEQGGAVTKRHMCLAEWPANVVDPIPVHPGDTLQLYFKHPVATVIVAPPAPTAQGFSVQPGTAKGFTAYHPVRVGNVDSRLGAINGDAMAMASPLPAAPSVGSTVTQTGLQYTLDDADCVQGHHIVLYVLNVPHNA